MDILQMIFWTIVAIIVLVGVHEFGHFWVARKLGVKVLVFSIGFGKAIWQKTARDGVNYRVCAIPLGGYVKMADERENNVAEADIPYAFNRQPLKIRTAIVFAGPLFNLIFAFISFWFVNVYGQYDWKPYIDQPVANSAFDQGGFGEGDLIRSINDREVIAWQDIYLEIVNAALDENGLEIEVLRQDGSLEQLRIASEDLAMLRQGQADLSKLGLKLLQPSLIPKIDLVSENSAASMAKIQKGDVIVQVNGKPVSTWSEVKGLIQQNPGIEMTLEIERSGGYHQLKLIPQTREIDCINIGYAGIAPEVPKGYADDFRVLISHGVLESIPLALTETWRISALTLKSLIKIFTGQMSLKNIGGPLSIAQASGAMAKKGISYYFSMLALFSITLGVVNLLPIPVLDGGHLFLFAVEAVRGHELSEFWMLKFQQIGLVIILGLLSLAISLDLIRISGISSCS